MVARDAKTYAVAALALAAIAGAGVAGAQSGAPTVGASASPSTFASPSSSASASPTASPPTASSDASAAAFLDIARVLQSPRCLNCHPVGDAPLNGDRGARHRMNVSRRSPSVGLGCTTCHRGTNGRTLHSPPGVLPAWRMPPTEHPMVFQGKTPRALCEGLKDPAQNGGKSLAALREHSAHDPLVLWGWHPGPGRTTPPLSHEDFVARVDTWIAGGATCP